MALKETASLTIAELREFASFAPCEQRYIKRSLDVGLGPAGRLQAVGARCPKSMARSAASIVAYRDLKALRSCVPDESSHRRDRRFHGHACCA